MRIKELHKDFYDFIKDRLDNFNLLLDNEYSIIIDSQYDESKDIVSIEIILSISDLLKPKDVHVRTNN